MKRFACDGRGIVGIEVVAKVVVVRVGRTIIVDVQVTDVQVAVGVAICIERRPYHHPLNNLEVEYNLIS